VEGNNYNCVLYTSHREGTAMHLFFTCPFAVRCWQLVGIQWRRGNPFFQMIQMARQDFNHQFFMETFTITASQIWKLRNGLIFEGRPANFNLWKRNFQEECLNQAHKMKNSLQLPFLSWVNSVV